jgi:hypothetical protein
MVGAKAPIKLLIALNFIKRPLVGN